MTPALADKKKILPLSLAALGVVYGDLGTSPLYAFHKSLTGLALTEENILGVVSLIFWALILVISTTYIAVFLRADNEGEGGVLALLSLLKRKAEHFPRIFFLMGLVGAGLLLGDGMITPAISVLSAVEGLKIVSHKFTDFIMPISFVILFLLFLFQRHGTRKIGFLFGPIILCWFLTIGILGLVAIIQNPTVLKALNPYYAYLFFKVGGWKAYLLLSGVFLVITGAEAMYADLGHFGRNPIRLSWFIVVLPALLLNYFGQGANLIQYPEAIHNTFYTLAPKWFFYPLLIIATLATIIASQAVISASFSLARQAVLLNVCPRLKIIHKSEGEKGQVYVPQINFIVGLGTLLLIVFFQTTDNLAAAYGMAVNLVMVIVAILMICVAYWIWNWSIVKIFGAFSFIIIIDLLFLGANFHKITQGAWIPLAFAVCIGLIMITWDKGTNLLRSSYYMNKIALPDVIEKYKNERLNYLEDVTTIFIADPSDNSGGGLLHYLEIHKIMPKQILILTVDVVNYPYISEDKCYKLTTISENIYELRVHYGFMQTINVPGTLSIIAKNNPFSFEIETSKNIYLLEMIKIATTQKNNSKLYGWQKKLFVFLVHNSQLDIEFFNLPYNSTISLGTYCEI